MLSARRNVLFGIASLPAATLLGNRRLPGLTATVYNGYELHTALQAAGQGSAIVLAPGDYGDVGRFMLTESGISLRAQQPLATTVRSALVVEGSFADLEGLAFKEGLILAGAGLRVVGSRFEGRGITVSGINAEVAGCEVANFPGPGISIKASARNAYVHDNYIHNSRGRGNGHEAIGIGASMRDSNTQVAARVENNRIVRCSAENEAVCVKSSGNVIRNNTLEDSRAFFSNRHGHGNLYQGNVALRSLGFVIQDSNTRLIANRCVSSRGFWIMGGNIPWNSTKQGGHPQAYNTYLEGNEGTVYIGRQYPGHRLAAVGTIVRSHRGAIKLMAEQGTQLAGTTRA